MVELALDSRHIDLILNRLNPQVLLAIGRKHLGHQFALNINVFSLSPLGYSASPLSASTQTDNTIGQRPLNRQPIDITILCDNFEASSDAMLEASDA